MNINIGQLLHIANSESAWLTTDDAKPFYELKKKILLEFAKPDGYDIQIIPKKLCYTCHGFGYTMNPDYKCDSCNGTGFHSEEKYIKLRRYILDNYIFHIPDKQYMTSDQLIYDSSNRIRGVIKHAKFPPKAPFHAMSLLYELYKNGLIKNNLNL